MPVPRRFDRQPPERDTTRINERIRVPEVRLIDEDGNQVGIKKTADALRYAQERDLDLVEVAPDAKPPVCRVLDYSKYKYEQAQKQKAARKHQQQIVIREIKFRPKIAQHDYDTKKNHVERFLRHKDKVKITIMFRGREMAHPERGEMILNRLAEDLGEMAVVEQRPQQDGRNMTMLLSPGKNMPPKDGAAPPPHADGATPETVARAPVAEADAEAPPEEAPAEEAPVEEAPVEEAPVEEAPVEEAPVEEAPVEEAPAEEAPAEEAPAEDAPARPPVAEPEAPAS